MGAGGEISRVDGLFLLMFFALVLRHTFTQAKLHPVPPTGEGSQTVTMPMLKSVIWVLLGLGGLVWGGDRFVDGASGIARSIGISEAVIGLTIVAAGTSLPELATSIVAAVKGKPGIAIGNVIGSNIFNVLFVLGVTATVSPLSFQGITGLDLTALSVSSLMFWAMGWLYKERTITRIEGAILTCCYIAYISYLVSSL